MGCELSRCQRGHPSFNVQDQLDGASDGKQEETIRMCVYMYTCMHNVCVCMILKNQSSVPTLIGIKDDIHFVSLSEEVSFQKTKQKKKKQH